MSIVILGKKSQTSQSNSIISAEKNLLAPVNIKLKVLNICATASLLYCCETWSNCTYTKLESLYRKGIRYALSIRNNTNNEIVYLESSPVPLFIQIKKRQLQFWKTLQTSFNDNPGNPMKQIIEKTELVNSKYVSYYKHLVNLHKTPTNCQKTLAAAFCDGNQSKIRTKAIADTDSKLGYIPKSKSCVKRYEIPITLRTRPSYY